MLGPCALAARISVQGGVWRMRWDRAPLPGGLNKDGSVGSPSWVCPCARPGSRANPPPVRRMAGREIAPHLVRWRSAWPARCSPDGGGASPSAGSRPILPAPHAQPRSAQPPSRVPLTPARPSRSRARQRYGARPFSDGLAGRPEREVRACQERPTRPPGRARLLCENLCRAICIACHMRDGAPLPTRRGANKYG